MNGRFQPPLSGLAGPTTYVRSKTTPKQTFFCATTIGLFFKNLTSLSNLGSEPRFAAIRDANRLKRLSKCVNRSNILVITTEMTAKMSATFSKCRRHFRRNLVTKNVGDIMSATLKSYGMRATFFTIFGCKIWMKFGY